MAVELDALRKEVAEIKAERCRYEGELNAQRNEWRARAEQAEAKLAAIRSRISPGRVRAAADCITPEPWITPLTIVEKAVLASELREWAAMMEQK
jgi:hypothetical protein